MHNDVFIHPTAEVSSEASIKSGTKIWHHSQVRDGAFIGKNCILGKGVYIDANVKIGNNVKIQNGVSVFKGVTLEDGVFCGPYCVFTNDLLPRAVNQDGSLKESDDWRFIKTLVKTGASIGANATILCGITIGQWAMIGGASLVTRDVPNHGLVYGNPARLHGFVCQCGEKIIKSSSDKGKEGNSQMMLCTVCNKEIKIPKSDFTDLVPLGLD